MKRKKRIFQYVGNTPIIPLSFKILCVFTCLLLLSNFTTNIINVMLNQHEVITLNNTIMASKLKDMYSVASNQYEIYAYSKDKIAVKKTLSDVSYRAFTNENTVCIGVYESGNNFFYSSANNAIYSVFIDVPALKEIVEKKENGILEGSISYNTKDGEYFGVYKYHEDWDFFLIWAELRSEINDSTFKVFSLIAILIVIFMIIFLWIGFIIFRRMFAPIKNMIASLYKMHDDQSMTLLSLEGASNDDISYLGASFNSLSSVINNLLSIFQKFVTPDLVDRAFEEGVVNLEGNQKDLAILFSDIRGFTYMTEVMGNDIISLLNIHYDRAIRSIHTNNGIIGSIIGDALLAVYGISEPGENKSVASLNTAWKIIQETKELRAALIERRKTIETERPLTESEERVYKAVLLEVGVGIDGGNVFYGNIGSSDHMTNTVIGDNVNSASRLEGLTRIYGLPIIVSKYIKDEVEAVSSQYKFVEIDTVQVKGKTEGKKIYTPIDLTHTTDEEIVQYGLFEKALALYYAGEWSKAKRVFEKVELPASQIFMNRIKSRKPPEGWNGIWTMETK